MTADLSAFAVHTICLGWWEQCNKQKLKKQYYEIT